MSNESLQNTRQVYIANCLKPFVSESIEGHQYGKAFQRVSNCNCVPYSLLILQYSYLHFSTVLSYNASWIYGTGQNVCIEVRIKNCQFDFYCISFVSKSSAQHTHFCFLGGYYAPYTTHLIHHVISDFRSYVQK